jgi:pimeloyl-ACP methyl ester carboxylesterase
MECRVKNLTVHYEEFGSGKPLLMLHGWPLDHQHMAHDMEPLFTKRCGWRRIYPDLPGMGKTRGADWITQQEQMLDAVISFIDTVAPGERLVVAGTSYGGYLARGLVYRRAAQLDGLMINVPVIMADAAKRNVPQHRVIREDIDFLAALTPNEQEIREIAVAQSMRVLEACRETIAPAVASADQAFLKRLSQSYSFAFDVDALEEPFPAPALFLTGRYDHWCGYQDAYRIFDNYHRGTFVVLDRAGHMLAVEQQTLFRVLVSEWLDRVEEYALAQESQQT